MLKIPTLLERNPGTRRVVSNYAPGVLPPSDDWVAFEKLPGATVRLTVRSGRLMRLEARRPPSKEDKEKGITEPWWREAIPGSDADYWLWEAAKNTILFDVPDGEWAGEAIGEKIQGNMLGIEGHRVILFGLIPWRDRLADTVEIPTIYERAPLTYEELEEWLPSQYSGAQPTSGIEGVVWWLFDEPIAKIKRLDFTFGLKGS